MSTNGTNSVGNVESRVVRFRFGICFVLLLLSCDAVNPVKVVCDILNVQTKYVSFASLAAMAFMFASHFGDMIYYMLKTFLSSIMQTFFASIEVLGKENIPIHGPIIFVGNHNNQFVDAALVLATNPHQVGFLIAQKSYDKPLIGHLAKAAGSIPVKRPQDYAQKAPGELCFIGTKVVGRGTNFNELKDKKGMKIRVGKSPEMYKLINIVSDTEAEVAIEKGALSPLEEKECQGEGNFKKWEMIPFIDQAKMYDASYDHLKKAKTIAIFPEGGSHDKTDLLPLKAGVSAIAFGILDKYDVNVPIVPIGLNYYKGHRFRQARVVVEYGEPIYITKELKQLYKADKGKGYQSLLNKVEDGMRSVLITADKYENLTAIHTARRLYQRASTVMSTKQKQDLARRFSCAYQILKQRDESGNEAFPEDIKTCMKNIEAYQKLMSSWGLKDYQVMNGLDVGFLEMIYHFCHGFIIMCIAAIPTLILNAPVGIAASAYAREEQQKDLAASRVKLAARDVVLSKKVLFSIAMVPLLWCFYATLLLFFRPWGIQLRTIIVLLLSFPLFSYIALTSVTAGLTDWKDMRPSLLRLFPSYREQVPQILKAREDLVREVRGLVKKYGPTLGDIYYEKTDKWYETIEKANKTK